MGRFCVTLDGPGWKYCAEPGADFEFRPAILLDALRRYYKSANPNLALPDDKLWIPPGTDSVMTYPRQLRPGWLQDTRLVDHVLRPSSYDWFTNLYTSSVKPDSVREWRPTKTPDGKVNTDDWWMTYPSVKAEQGHPAPQDFTNVGLAAGVTFPSTEYLEAWTASRTPRGETIILQGYTPYIQFFMYPEPFLPLVIQVATFYFVFTQKSVIMLREENPVSRECVKLGAWDTHGHEFESQQLAAHRVSSGNVVGTGIHPVLRTLMMVPFGNRHMYLWFGYGDPVCVEISSADDVLLKGWPQPGSWAMYCREGSRVTWQTQIVGYEDGDTDVFSDPATPSVFKLGANYGLSGGPTIEPKINAQVQMYHNPASPGDVVLTVTQNEIDFLNLVTLAHADIQLRDDAGSLWASDGTHTSGNLRIHLKPDGRTDSQDYRPVQCDWIWFRFPRKLVDRAFSGITLLDTQFKSAKAEAELPNLSKDGKSAKTIEVEIWDAGLEILIAAGLDEREGYPVEIFEDVNGDDVYEIRRAAGWIDHPDLEEYHVRDSDGKRINFYRMNARGLLGRAEFPWVYEPMLIDTGSGGHISHTYVVARVVDDSGFDSTDTAQFFLQDDPFPNSAFSWLPGDWVRNPMIPGVHRESIWCPEIDESMRDYATRIGREWRGWQFYENLAGKILYHNELQWELALGFKYYVSAIVYRSAAEAVAAGKPAKQTYLTKGRRTIEPVTANVIKAYGSDSNAENVVVVRDTDSYGSDTTVENFVGEPRVNILRSSLAQDSPGKKDVLNQLAASALMTRRLRKVMRTYELNLPLWDLVREAGATEVPDVGYVLTLQGLGDFIIQHHEAHIDKRTRVNCTVTGCKVPSTAVKASPGTLLYPGRTK